MSLFVFMHEVWVFDYFTNRYSRLGYVDRKYDALDTFIEFKAWSNNLLGKHFKVLRLGWGGMSNKFDYFHKENEIIS